MTTVADRTPADELRAAAALLRETASRATPGPWGAEEVSARVLGVLSYSASSPVASIGDPAEPYVPGDAAWIALASPALAEPLARWLSFVAETWVHQRATARHQALAVARAITGGTDG